MALYSGAEWRPLAAGNPGATMTAHDIVCVHTMVGYLQGTEDMFRQNGWTGTESHFGIGGSSDGGNDGAVWQWVDTDYQADANLEGNPRLISIETSDGGDETHPWSAAQLDGIVGVIVWACREYGIPAELVADSTPGLRGIGYHRQGIDPWRVQGGEKWSNANGKVCPGDVRLAQLLDEVIPRVQQEVGAVTPASTTLRFDAIGPAAATVGAQVVLTGAGFSGANGVSFGGTWVQDWTIDSDSQITATVPDAMVSGEVSVVVSSPDSTSAALGFTYLDEFSAGLALTGMSPTSGLTGSQAILFGTGFLLADGVSFGDAWVQDWTIDSDSQITVTVPDAMVSGDVWVTVSSPGASSGSLTFTYE